MKKRGFTLVELMGVLVIIGLLSLILIPVISNVIKKQKEDQYQQQIAHIELSSKNFGSDNLVILPTEEGESMYITLGQLKSLGYLDQSIINPITDEEISDCAKVVITKVGNSYTYEYDESSENDTSCNSWLNNSVIISEPIKKYIKENTISSYIITVNDQNDENVLNKYEIKKDKITLTGTTDAIFSVIEGNAVYRVVIRGRKDEGEVGIRLESGAIIKNELENIIDEEGVESTEKIIVDNTQPTIAFGTNGNSTWSQSASSTITVNDNTSVDTNTFKYIYSTNASATPTTPFENGGTYSKNNVTGNYYLIAYACDMAGNCKKESSQYVFKLDNTGPTITFGTNGNNTYAKTGSSTITVSDSHAGGKTSTYKYIYSTSSSATPTMAFTSGSTKSQTTGTGNYYLIAYACDNAGNCITTKTTNTFKLDNTGPTITFGTNGNNTYAKTGSSTITVSDSHAGGKTSTYKYIYSTSSSATPTTAFTSGSTKSQTTGTGNYYLIAYACDSLGNCTKSNTTNTFKLDNTGPTITFGTNGNNTYAKTGSSTITVSDSHAGGKTSTYKYIYSTSSSATPTTAFTSGSTKSQTTGTGNYYLIAYACDNAGNCITTKTTNTFKIDNTAPTITFGTNGNNTYAKTGSSTITVRDDQAGGDTSSYKYIYSTSRTATPTTAFTSGSTKSQTSGTGDYFLIAYACDMVGNCTTSNTNTFKIDNTRPTITNVSVNNCSNNKRTINISASDDQAGIGGYVITSSTSTPALTAFTNDSRTTITSGSFSPGTYYAWVKDGANNISSYTTVTVGACDTTPPVIKFGTNGSNGIWKSQASTTVTAEDTAGIKSISYGWSTSKYSEITTGEIKSGNTLNSKCNNTEGDCYLFVRACDNNDLCSTARTEAFKVDAVPPEVTAIGLSTIAKGFDMEYEIIDNGSGIVKYAHIYCDVSVTGEACLNAIETKNRWYKTDPVSKISKEGEWTTCADKAIYGHPVGNRPYKFYVKAYDKVGNVVEQNTGEVKPCNNAQSCPACN